MIAGDIRFMRDLTILLEITSTIRRGGAEDGDSAACDVTRIDA
ncbi:MAG: hypothetical protein AAFP69_15335 [Planctomycetota bacterium]